MILDVNTDACIVMTNKLERLHRSAFPNAVRETLSKAALDVKKVTLLKSADNEFVKRQPNFFRANSRVDFAKGYNISAMKATVGMVEGGLKGGNNYAVKDLEQQEEGGVIGGRSFVPMDGARVGGNSKKIVKAINRISNIKKIANTRNVKGVNWSQRVIKSAVFAGKGGYVLDWRSGKSGILYRINSITRNGGNVLFKKTALFSVNKNRKLTIRATSFMKSAALETADKLEKIYIIEANKQIGRLMNKK